MEQDTSNGEWVSAEAILAAQDLPEADVPTPEWGGKVRVRALTMAEVLAIRKSAGADERQVVVATFVQALVHPPMTTEQAEALLSKAGAVVQRVLLAINGLNQVGEGGPEVPAVQRAFPRPAGTTAGTDPGEGTAPDAG